MILVLSPAAFAGDDVTAGDRFYWDLTDLYPSSQAWESRFAEISDRVVKLRTLSGTLGQGAGSMLKALTAVSDTYKEAARLFVYAQLNYDEDQREAEAQARIGKARALLADLGRATAWMGPEIIRLGEKQVDAFLKQQPGLSKFAFQLRDTLRQAPHTLSEEGERVIAQAGLLAASPSDIYDMYKNASIAWPTITLADGSEAKLNPTGYTRYRTNPDRADRKAVFDAFWGKWQEFSNGMGATLNGEVQANIFQARARNFDSVLQQNMFDDAIPAEINDTLIEQVNSALPIFYRYLALRQRMLKVDKLAYYDIYAPIVGADEGSFDLALASQITLNALQPFGETYVSLLQEGLAGDWMHSHPQEGKETGAYVFGWAYDVHPYVLLNHNDDYDSLTTFAHEWGHAVHTLLASQNNPWETADDSTFLAEMASTINEILLQEYMIAHAENKGQKLAYLDSALESLRGTVFRQTMFTEFERAIHASAESGEALTGNVLNEQYLALLRRYHGHGEGVMEIDELYGIEWASVPHFYNDFYVYQYATSMSGAVWFADRILAGDQKVRDAFIRVLQAGGSDYPHDILLREAGLDMRKPDAYQAAFRRMENIMDRIELLLDE